MSAIKGNAPRLDSIVGQFHFKDHRTTAERAQSVQSTTANTAATPMVIDSEMFNVDKPAKMPQRHHTGDLIADFNGKGD